MFPDIIILPVSEPVFIFTILLLIIFIIPFILRRINVPDIAGYIITGLVIGPYGLNILQRDENIKLFGTVGLLYLMFMAGVELKMTDFLKHKNNSILFGLLTFIFPFMVGMAVSIYLLHLGLTAAFLVSIMFSTHTLIAYPAASRMGIANDRAVMAAVGGTIITDTLVLLLLSFVTGTTFFKGTWLSIPFYFVLFAIYLLVILVFIPGIASVLFKNVKIDKTIQFIFILLMVFLSASLAKLLGIEPIIGAFAAGIALNRVIPRNSNLLQNVAFVGNALFIPLFLLSIGMLINVNILVESINVWYIAVLLIISALTGKWIAAQVAGKLIRFNRLQRNVLFGLTSSHAAATIAVILIGFEKGIISSSLFNATILIILVTCLFGSVVTEIAGKKLALKQPKTIVEVLPENERVMVSMANPCTTEILIQIALSVKNQESNNNIYILNIVNFQKYLLKKSEKVNDSLVSYLQKFHASKQNIDLISRVDVNITDGIIKAVRDFQITHLVIGWGGKVTKGQIIFGSIFEYLLDLLRIPLIVCNLESSLHSYQKIRIMLPTQFILEPRCNEYLDKILQMPFNKKNKIEFIISNESKFKTKDFVKTKRIQPTTYNSLTGLKEMMDASSDGLTILLYPRKYNTSYDKQWENLLKGYIYQKEHKNFILFVPGEALAE